MNKQRNWKSKGKKNEKNNYQDAAMEREFKKGEKFACDTAKADRNDPQWYFKNAQILKDVASFSFSKPLGTRTGFYDTVAEVPGVTNNQHALTISAPGLLSIGIGPTIGIAEDSQSPVNLAATNVYSYVRYKNSGAANYDAPDIMLYLIAMDSIYSCWNWMKRIYGVASTYSQLNRYQPLAYMAANGVDFADILSNLADFRAYLNIKASEIATFCVPATMTFNVRHSWLFSNIYTDSETYKAQEYMFVPLWFYQYDETSSSQGGKLTPVPVLQGFNPQDDTPKYTFQALKDLLNTMINMVNYSEDIGIMSGDILKAYGEGGLYTLSTFEPDYKVEPVYSKEVLSQIENATVVSNLDNTSLQTFTITQDPNTNYLKCAPTVTGPLSAIGDSHILNFHWNDPSPEDVVVATRLKASFHRASVSAPNVITSLGSEFVSGVWVFNFAVTSSSAIVAYNISGPLKLVAYSPNYVPTIPGGTGQTTSTVSAKYVQRIAEILNYMSFDWAPIIPYRNGFTPTNSDDATVLTYCGLLGDIDNYTLLDEEDLQAMHLMALLTEFNVPN